LKSFIVDASVAARFILVEDLTDKAEKVLEDYLSGTIDLYAPRLIVAEIGNTLWRAIKLKIMTLEEAENQLLNFLKLGIKYVDLSYDDFKEVLRLAKEKDITYYDSIYAYSSIKLKIPLLTADNKLYNKVKDQVKVIHLRNYE